MQPTREITNTVHVTVLEREEGVNNRENQIKFHLSASFLVVAELVTFRAFCGTT